MIDTAAFKISIIDLAVSGKLSERFQASDSVSEIIAELPKVSNKRKKLLEQTFEYGNRNTIPAHWKWIRLGEMASYGDTPTKAFFDDVSGDTWILDLEDIKSGGELIAKTRVCGKKFAGDKTVFRKGQVLYSKLRPYLRKVLVADEDGISTPELISFDTFGGVIPQYIVYCLLSSFTGRAIDKRSYGIKMPRVDAGFMVNLPIPLPPVSEQQYIVDHVQAAFAQIDIIDSLQAQYADNLTVLKRKLIDAAIQGNLTEQLPEDGTAEELYQKIQAEKQERIKAGKIKKEKTLPEITADEIPFEIPTNWKWARIGKVFTLQSGKNMPANEIYDYSDEAHFVPCYGGNGIRGFVAEYNQEGEYSLIGRQGALSGNVQYAKGRFKNTEHALLVTPKIQMNSIWLNQLLINLELKRFQTGAAQPGLSVKNLQDIPIITVSIEKQNRFADFVAKIDKSKAVIQKSLEEAQLLFDSLMQQYFG